MNEEQIRKDEREKIAEGIKNLAFLFPSIPVESIYDFVKDPEAFGEKMKQL